MEKALLRLRNTMKKNEKIAAVLIVILVFVVLLALEFGITSGLVWIVCKWRYVIGIMAVTAIFNGFVSVNVTKSS